MKVAKVAKRRWLAHSLEWSECTACPLHEFAFRHVLFRGVLPCEVLLIGEGPGKTEDNIGAPFVGRAGKLLDQWLDYIDAHRSVNVRWGLTNVVACRPTGELGGENREPLPAELAECSPRVSEIIQIAEPRIIVCVGRVAERVFRRYQRVNVPSFYLIHPAAVLRAGGAGSELNTSVLTGFRSYIDGCLP